MPIIYRTDDGGRGLDLTIPCCCLGTLILMTSANGAEIPRPGDAKDDLVRKIEHYQTDISPQLHEALGVKRICRYEPSCSQYAKEAIEEYGPVRGTTKAAARLLRCNPFSGGGYDPVKKA